MTILNSSFTTNDIGIEVTAAASVNLTSNQIFSNSTYGVYVHDSSGSNVTVVNNDIYANGQDGVYFKNASRPLNVSGNRITGNGTTLGSGIRIEGSSSSLSSTIKNHALYGPNVIAGNSANGISLINSNFPSLVIEVNRIGINSNGQALGNGGAGISANNSVLQKIGQNFVANNGASGIYLAETNGVNVTTNVVGTNSDVLASSTDMGNGGPGILLDEGTENTIVAFNTIAYNDGAGVAVVDDTGDSDKGWRNAMVSNQFWSNSGPPIDLNNDGVTPQNDPDDGDSGPNSLLNSPELVQGSVTLVGGTWQFNMRIDVDKTGGYGVQFYKLNPGNKSIIEFKPQLLTDPYIFQVDALVSNGPDKLINLSFTNGVDAAEGDQIVAVLIGDSGVNENNTSEFTSPIMLDVAPPQIVDVRLDSTIWSSSLNYSYAQIRASGGNYLKPIYTQNVNQLQVVFSEAINQATLTSATAKLYGSYGASIALGTPSFAGNVATWTLAAPLSAGKYRLELSSGVTDIAGKGLDGEWVNLAGPANHLQTFDYFVDDVFTTDNTFPSGNGVAGGTFGFDFSILPGDYNQDGLVRTSGANSDLAVRKDGNGDGSLTTADDLVATNATTIELPLRARSGDYRSDSVMDNDVVGPEDYLVWRSTFGNILANEADGYLEADGSGNGTVDAADYALWAHNVGLKSVWGGAAGSSSGSGTSVPVFDPINVPRIANVVISGSASMHAPFSFTTVDGSGLQLAAVPVGGADTISIVFSEDVNIQSDYLTLTGLRTANRPVVADFAYDINTMTASWRFMNLTANDSYVISLSDAVTDIEGNNLDGEWVNPATIATTNSLVSVFPSGDGDAGGRFNFVFTLLAGDANLNAYVTFDDFQLMYVNYGVTMGMLFADGDFNGDGAVSFDDYQLFSTNYGLNLQSAWMLADLNADNAVDQSDIDLLVDNLGMSNPDWADGDLNSDGLVDGSDLDLAFAQFGIEVSLVS